LNIAICCSDSKKEIHLWIYGQRKKGVAHNSTGAASVSKGLVYFYPSKVVSNTTCTLSFSVPAAAIPGEAAGNRALVCGAASVAAQAASTSNLGFGGGGLIQVAVGFAGGFGVPLTKRSGWAGECQGSCRLNSVMIPPIDDAAVLAA
jgi:hypothetical protein